MDGEELLETGAGQDSIPWRNELLYTSTTGNGITPKRRRLFAHAHTRSTNTFATTVFGIADELYDLQNDPDDENGSI